MDEAETNPLIEVLLATHNGAAYLPQQIASLFQQTHENVRVFARDDGSTDTTRELLQTAARHYGSRFQVMESTTATGSAAGNFRELLLASSAEYVAFCDQDDVWLPEKLSSSLQVMRNLERKHGKATPLIVFSDLEVVDVELAKVSNSLWSNNRIDPSSVQRLPRLLSENVVTGCTLLMNRPMASLAKRMPDERSSGLGIIMHDHWVALLAATLGRAAWLPAPTVLYRQHASNVVGAAREDRSLRGKLLRLFGRSAYAARRSDRLMLERQAAQFLNTYRDELPVADQQVLQSYSTLAQQGRIQQVLLTFRYGFWRATVARNLTTLLDALRGGSGQKHR